MLTLSVTLVIGKNHGLLLIESALHSFCSVQHIVCDLITIIAWHLTEMSSVSLYNNQPYHARASAFNLCLGVDQLPVAMRGPQGLLCFLKGTTPGGSKKLGWPLILWSP